METIQNSLLDYGVLGIFCAAFIAAIVFLYRVNQKSHETMTAAAQAAHQENQTRILALETKLETYLAEDRRLLTATVEDCTRAIENNSRILEKFLQTPAVK